MEVVQLKTRKGRNAKMRCAERVKQFSKTMEDAPRGKYTIPGSHNPHKGRGGSTRKR